MVYFNHEAEETETVRTQVCAMKTNEPIGYRFRLHAPPGTVKETAEKIRAVFGFDFVEGTEHVWFSAFVPAECGDAVGAFSYMQNILHPLLGWKPATHGAGRLQVWASLNDPRPVYLSGPLFP